MNHVGTLRGTISSVASMRRWKVFFQKKKIAGKNTKKSIVGQKRSRTTEKGKTTRQGKPKRDTENVQDSESESDASAPTPTKQKQKDKEKETTDKNVAATEGKKKKEVHKSKYIEDKPYKDDLPPAIEGRMKTSVNDIFKDVKFFHTSSSVDSTPSLMDYVFKSIGLDNVDDPAQKLARAKLWNVLCHKIWREINKLRSNKITTFYSLLKSK